jgi:UV DNA damage repair endonuclease
VPQTLIVDTQLRLLARHRRLMGQMGITPKNQINKSSSFTNMIG